MTRSLGYQLGQFLVPNREMLHNSRPQNRKPTHSHILFAKSPCKEKAYLGRENIFFYFIMVFI